jgi:hypothetical protein
MKSQFPGVHATIRFYVWEESWDAPAGIRHCNSGFLRPKKWKCKARCSTRKPQFCSLPLEHQSIICYMTQPRKYEYLHLRHTALPAVTRHTRVLCVFTRKSLLYPFNFISPSFHCSFKISTPPFQFFIYHSYHISCFIFCFLFFEALWVQLRSYLIEK